MDEKSDYKIPNNYIEIKELLPVEAFATPAYLNGFMDGVVIPEGLIHSRLEKMALDVANHYRGKKFKIFCILKGSSRVFEDLCRLLRQFSISGAFDQDIEYEFVKISSYDGKSQGEVKVEGLDLSKLKGQNILIVEDLVDTGRTLTRFIKALKEQEVADIKLFVLCDKHSQRMEMAKDLHIDFLGFRIPNYWIIGYGMDAD